MALLAVIRSFAVRYSTMSRTKTGSRGWQITVREPILTRSVSRHNLNSQLAAQVGWLWESKLRFEKRVIRSHWQTVTGQKGKKTAWHLCWYSVYRAICRFIIRLVLFPLTFRHRASCILGQAFHCSPENAFYIFNQQMYIIIWYLLDRASLI